MGLKEMLGLKKKEEQTKETGIPLTGKYAEPCALCQKTGTEKKWMGQYWHKKCLRKSKKMVKGMI